MKNYRLTKRAVEVLNKIWHYPFNEWSEKQADKYYNLLVDSFENIGQNPNLGKRYSGIKRELLG
jgi:toxin ParE1/3/4